MFTALVSVSAESAQIPAENTSIRALNKMEIIKGDEKGNLNEDANISREEYLALILRASGREDAAKEAADRETPFQDAKGHWARGYVNVAAQNGIVNGITETEFGIGTMVTFNQAVKMAVVMVGYRTVAEEKGGYPEGYIVVANEIGITDRAVAKETPLTRAEASNIIYFAMQTGVLQADGKTVGDSLMATRGYVATKDGALKLEKETFNLWEDGTMPLSDKTIEQTPVIKSYVVEGENRPAVVFFPGGTYHHISVKESNEITKILNELGISVFLVEYRCTPYTEEAILADAYRAMRYVRTNAEKYNIAADKVGVMGCSAGGHLAATVSTLFDEAKVYLNDEIDAVSARPDFAILSYPVISFADELTHKDSRTNFTGSEEPDAEIIEKYSNEKNVTKNTPPTFIWHTMTDPYVPVGNSLEYVAALVKSRVPCELHIYPKGGHGLASAKGVEGAENWSAQLGIWFATMDITE